MMSIIKNNIKSQNKTIIFYPKKKMENTQKEKPKNSQVDEIIKKLLQARK